MIDDTPIHQQKGQTCAQENGSQGTQKPAVLPQATVVDVLLSVLRVHFRRQTKTTVIGAYASSTCPEY